MSLKTFVLLSIIALTGTFIYIKVQSLGAETSVFNQTTRISIGRHVLLRELFGFYNNGDARAWYLNGVSPITLEIVESSNAILSASAIQQFSSEITKYTGRPVSLKTIDTISSGTISDSQIDAIVPLNAVKLIKVNPTYLLSMLIIMIMKI